MPRVVWTCQRAFAQASTYLSGTRAIITKSLIMRRKSRHADPGSGVGRHLCFSSQAEAEANDDTTLKQRAGAAAPDPASCGVGLLWTHASGVERVLPCLVRDRRRSDRSSFRDQRQENIRARPAPVGFGLGKQPVFGIKQTRHVLLCPVAGVFAF